MRTKREWLIGLGLVCTACGVETPPSTGGTTGDGNTASTSAAAGSTGAPASTGADDSTTVSDSTTVFTLSDGTEVRVDEDGGVTVFRDQRRVFALAGTPGPQGRRFEETYGGGIGLWTVGRGSESSVAHTFADASMSDDAVEVRWTDEEGSTLSLEFSVGIPTEVVRMTGATDSEFDAVALPLECDEGAGFHGFGEQYGATNQRGEAFRLWLTEQGIGRDPELPLLPINGNSHTTYFPMAYYFDPRGFGGLFRTQQPVEVDICASNPELAWFELRDGIDLSIFAGPTGYDVIRQLGEEVGRPSLPPAWAWEPWIAMQGGQDDVTAEIARLDTAGIPYSAVWVQDWTGIRPNLDGGFGVEYRWRTDTELYPDLPGMVADLHADGKRFLGYANPFIDPDLDHFEDMSSSDMLLKDANGEDYVAFAPNILSAHLDFTAPQTQAYVQAELRAMVEDIGMDGWMADFGEWAPLDAVVADGTDPIAYHETFPLHWHQQWRAVMDELRPDGDFAVFARSGATGVHATAQIYWIGDQEADFSPHDGLPTVVPAMLNLGLSGIPFVTHDIAGFSGGPSTKELFLRWTELGAFTPIMRTHEGSDKENNWRWESDDETIAHLRRFARVHVALTDELAALAELAAETGAPMVRPLMLEFPEDPGAVAVSDSFLLGSDLLVAPVVEAGATIRTVYLPAGATWFHVWTGDSYDGGQSVEVEAPVGSPPVFSRDSDRSDLRMVE